MLALVLLLYQFCLAAARVCVQCGLQRRCASVTCVRLRDKDDSKEIWESFDRFDERVCVIDIGLVFFLVSPSESKHPPENSEHRNCTGPFSYTARAIGNSKSRFLFRLSHDPLSVSLSLSRAYAKTVEKEREKQHVRHSAPRKLY